MCKDRYSWSQQDAKAKDQSFLEESSPKQWLVKTLKATMNLLNSLIYEPNVLRMMENMGYDPTNGPGLNFGKGRRTLLLAFVPKKEKPLIIIIELAGGWGLYVDSNLVGLWICRLSDTSSWELGASVGSIFKEISINMVSTSHPEDGDEKMIQSDTDP